MKRPRRLDNEVRFPNARRFVARLELSTGGSISLRASSFPFNIGRMEGNDLGFRDLGVSRRHCRLEYSNRRLIVRDVGSRWGTIVDGRRLHKQAVRVTKPTPIVLGRTIIWVLPAGKGTGAFNVHNVRRAKPHGVCLADICDSSKRDVNDVQQITEGMRRVLLTVRPEALLLLKHTGDGHLAVFRAPKWAIVAADRLMSWRNSEHRLKSFDLRITLDAGPTIETVEQDRIGTVLIRTVRLEKTSRSDLKIRAAHANLLRDHNRCLVSSFCRARMTKAQKQRCTFLGKRNFKGFGAHLFDVYQYDPVIGPWPRAPIQRRRVKG